MSEVRSMLPPGLSADLATGAEARALRDLAPDARTVARLLVGSCSCDFVIARDPEARSDERHLRARYAALGLARNRVIAALDHHRRGAPARRPPPLAERQLALAAFVAEHARNAGPSLYYLRFGPGPAALPAADAPVTTFSAAEVRRRPDDWLAEDRPTLVTR